jgi:hypothetical protein
MTDNKVTFGELCDAWKDQHRDQERGHLPTSTLFDLTRQSLTGDEYREAVQHLAECSDCLRDLKEMVRIRARFLLVRESSATIVDALSLAPLGTAVHPADRLAGVESASALFPNRSVRNV